jgi:hypothetical protein
MKPSHKTTGDGPKAAFRNPRQVRYIKLGEGGKWERECRETGIIRFGFDSATDERFSLSCSGKWKELTAHFAARGKSKGTATRFTNETRRFFEDDGSTLWITFIAEDLLWGFLVPGQPTRHADGDGTFRRIEGGWRCVDLLGERLTKERLSGALTKLAAYRGTSCKVDEADYVTRRIKGQKIPEVERALASILAMRQSILDLMRKLGPRDFETLVDLVFTSSGWRRQGVVGKTQKMLDLDIILPSTGERAFVQVKSKTNSAELAEYTAQLNERGPFDKMFYVFHSHSGDVKSDDDKVVVIGPDKLPEMVIDAGLANWLIRKVS